MFKPHGRLPNQLVPWKIQLENQQWCAKKSWNSLVISEVYPLNMESFDIFKDFAYCESTVYFWGQGLCGAKASNIAEVRVVQRSVLVTVELLVLRMAPEPWLAFRSSGSSGSIGSSGSRLGGDAHCFCFPSSHPFLVDFSPSLFFFRSFVTSYHLTKCLLSPGLQPSA